MPSTENHPTTTWGAATGDAWTHRSTPSPSQSSVMEMLALNWFAWKTSDSGWHATTDVARSRDSEGQPSRLKGDIENSSLPCSGKLLPIRPDRHHQVRHGWYSFYHQRLSQLGNYHFIILWCAVINVMVIVINLSFTIWATTNFDMEESLGTLKKGKCEGTKTLNFWIHLMINILSILLLGASSHSMQCLSSPTRKKIDQSHAQRAWLDVGIPSLKNLRRLSWSRISIWWLLAISSILLHLLYISTVFSSLSTQEYNGFLVSEDFVEGVPFNATARYANSDGYGSGVRAPEIPTLLQ